MGIPIVLPDEAQIPNFKEIYGTYFSYVWNLLRRFGVWERDLEDCTHDVFVVVHRRLDTYDKSRPIKPWLGGIAANIASEFRRKAQHRREMVMEDIEVPDQGPSADHQMAAAEKRKMVLAGLDKLDGDQRDVFVLHDIEGYSMPEIAENLQVGLNTLYSRLRLARKKFAKEVSRLKNLQGEL